MVLFKSVPGYTGVASSLRSVTSIELKVCILVVHASSELCTKFELQRTRILEIRHHTDTGFWRMCKLINLIPFNLKF